MTRMLSMIVGLSYVVALAFVGPAGARTRHGRAGQSSHQGSGRQVFMRNCARCHGASGQGKNGPQLAGKSLGQDAIEEKVTDGGGKMPSFKKQLSSDQIKAVAAYVQSLGSRS